MFSASISSCTGWPRWRGVRVSDILSTQYPWLRRYRKSQLAIEHCYRTRKNSQKTWVFWAHASNTSRLEQSFWDIADQAKIRGRLEPQVNVFKLVRDWLRDEKNGPWLFVLDNADDAAVLSPSAGKGKMPAKDADGNDSSATNQWRLFDYLPPSEHGSVLVTSRTNRAAKQLVERSDIIPIEPMQDAAARALLHSKLGDVTSIDADVAELAILLDCMPLALVQAAAYIRERAPRCSVRQYIEQYRQSDNSKTSLLNQEAEQLRRDQSASNSVLITWQISFEHVRSIRKSAADLLSLMSFFDRQGIQEYLLYTDNSNGTGEDNTSAANQHSGFEDDIHTLRDYSFIKIRDNKTFEMHSLVQLATRKWLDNRDEIDKWRSQFVVNLCANFPTAEFENWATCQALFPHVKVALTQQPEDNEALKSWAVLLRNAASFSNTQGKGKEAEDMSIVSIKVLKDLLGEEDEKTLHSMHDLAYAMNLQGRLDEAESLIRHLLPLMKKVIGLEHPDTLLSMHNLAVMLASQHHYDEALSLSERAYAGRCTVLGEEHPGTRNSYEVYNEVKRRIERKRGAEGEEEQEEGRGQEGERRQEEEHHADNDVHV